jgi:hypothetical protein
MAFTNPTNVSVGSVLTASRYNQDVVGNWNMFGAAWTTFTPTLTAVTTNPNLGSTGTTNGAYLQLGKFVCWWGVWTPGGSGIAAGTGEYRIALPVASKRTDVRTCVASGYASNGTTSFFSASLDVNPSATSARVFVSGPTAIASPMGSTAVNVVAGWQLSVMGIYEAA